VQVHAEYALCALRRMAFLLYALEGQGCATRGGVRQRGMHLLYMLAGPTVAQSVPTVVSTGTGGTTEGPASSQGVVSAVQSMRGWTK